MIENYRVAQRGPLVREGNAALSAHGQLRPSNFWGAEIQDIPAARWMFAERPLGKLQELDGKDKQGTWGEKRQISPRQLRALRLGSRHRLPCRSRHPAREIAAWELQVWQSCEQKNLRAAGRMLPASPTAGSVPGTLRGCSSLEAHPEQREPLGFTPTGQPCSSQARGACAQRFLPRRNPPSLPDVLGMQMPRSPPPVPRSSLLHRRGKKV